MYLSVYLSHTLFSGTCIRHQPFRYLDRAMCNELLLVDQTWVRVGASLYPFSTIAAHSLAHDALVKLVWRRKNYKTEKNRNGEGAPAFERWTKMRWSVQRTAKEVARAEIPDSQIEKTYKVIRHLKQGQQCQYYEVLLFRKAAQRKPLKLLEYHKRKRIKDSRLRS